MAVDARHDEGAVSNNGDVIVIEHLTKVFDGRGGKVRAVDDLSLSRAAR